MKRLALILVLTAAAAPLAAQGESPWTAWPYRLRLRVANPRLSDDTGMAQLEVNLGSAAQPDRRDVLVIDANGYERPWYLRSSNSSGDSRIVFETVKGTYDYTLLFGKPDAVKPPYEKRWTIGRVVIDDFLPKKAYIHGLWSWVKTPTFSGEYAHTNPVTDRFNYHGTSEIRGYALYESSVIRQYVMLDEKDPPEEIVIRLVYEQRPGANSWDSKNYINCYWGTQKIRDIGAEGYAQSVSTVKMGELPEPGKWTRLTIDMKELLRKVRFEWRGGGLPDLFGLEFCTDKGRAWWDLTTVGDVPAAVEIVAFERRAPAASPPAFVYLRRRSFILPRTKTVLNEVELLGTLEKGATCRWDFGDGTTSDLARPVHVFEGKTDAKVGFTVADAGGGTVTASGPVTLLQDVSTAREFAIDLVSIPLIVRADDKALFNLRLEGDLAHRMDVDLVAVLQDAGGKELRRERAVLAMLPGEKHPTFRAFSLDVAEPDLARIVFRLMLQGRTLAEREVMVYASTADLADVALAGDRYLDRFKRPAFIRCGLPGDVPRTVSRGLPLRTVILGDLPTGAVPVVERLAKAVAEADSTLRDAKVERLGVSPLPAWSMPYRQALDVAGGALRRNTDVVIIASAAEMLLAGVPARTGVDAISVCIDQVRRRTDAEILLLTPTVYSELEDLSRQYAVAIRMLGIEKNVRVIDVYSRSLQLGGKNPDLLKTEKVTDGFLVHELHPEMIDMVVATIVEQLRHPTKVIQVSP